MRFMRREGHTMNRQEITDRVNYEMGRQVQKFGEQHHDNFKWCAILTEETGEVCKASLDTSFNKTTSREIVDELIHVIAVCTTWLVNDFS